MDRVHLQNNEWTKILEFLRTCQGIYIGSEPKCRRFMNAVLWVMRSGAQWRLLPKSYGKWNSVYKRFARWCEKGLWTQMLAAFADDPDMESLIIDSTLVRAHPCAAGAPAARGGQAHQAVGRSRCVFPEKIPHKLDSPGTPQPLRLHAASPP